MSQLPQYPETLNKSRHEERRGCAVIIVLFVMAGIVAGALSSGEFETFWLAVLVLLTDLLLVAVLAIVAEQVTTTESRKRWQLSVGKLLQLTAAIGIYLGLARYAYLASIPVSHRMDPGSWIIVVVKGALFVAASFPVILFACEGLIWVIVDVQKTLSRRSRDDGTRTR